MYIVPGCKRVRVSRGNPGYIVSSHPPFCLSTEDVPPFPSSDAGTARRERLSSTPFAPAGSCIPCCRKKARCSPPQEMMTFSNSATSCRTFCSISRNPFSPFSANIWGWSGGSVLRYTSLNHKTGEPGFGTMPFPLVVFPAPM